MNELERTKNELIEFIIKIITENYSYTISIEGIKIEYKQDDQNKIDITDRDFINHSLQVMKQKLNIIKQPELYKKMQLLGDEKDIFLESEIKKAWNIPRLDY